VKRRIKRLLVLVAIAAVMVFVVKFVATPYVVIGESMLPTLKSWDLCVMQRTRDYQPRRGDIIVFRDSDDPPLHFVKRVIGLSGETVAIRAGKVMLDDKPFPENYTTPNPAWEMGPVTVPAGKIFVIGDNRDYELEETPHWLVAMRLVEARLLWDWRWKR
jgi:signal peptidase I